MKKKGPIVVVIVGFLHNLLWFILWGSSYKGMDKSKENY
jgi:hypothetical protein